MKAELSPLTITASDGSPARLHLVRWLPDGRAPQGVVLLAHGYAEHGGRYDHVAAALNAAGYAVYAPDHWGHGQSDGTPGFVHRFDDLVAGMRALIERVEADFPGTPRLLLGHSMGGLISALLLTERQGDFVAAALSGPAIVPAEPPSRVMQWISRFLSRFFPRVGVLALDANAVSRDPAVVAAYRADPLVYTGKISARLAAEFFDAMAAARAGAPRITLPLLLQHGTDDALAAPAGSQYLFDHVRSDIKRIELLPGLYHEIFNEPEQVAVLGDLVGWFDAHCPRDKEMAS